MSEKAIQPFDQVLRQINHGRLIDELTDEMTEVLQRVAETGCAGALNLKIKFVPHKNQIEVKAEIKGSLPQPIRPLSLFFLNEDGGLTRDDPLQKPLDLGGDMQSKTIPPAATKGGLA